MATGAFIAYSSKNAKIRYNSLTIWANAWTVEPTAARLKTTHFESGGVEEGITGIRSIKFTIEMDDNGYQNTFIDAAITAGKIGSVPLLLYLNDTSGPFWSITSPHFETLPMKAGVEDSMKLTITGSGNGAWAYPLTGAGATT